MSNIYQVIEDLSADAMRDLLVDRMGYPYDRILELSERGLRATIQDDYQRNLLSGRDIREMAEGA